MGAITDTVEDAKAVAILDGLPVEAKKWLRHHFRNSLQAVMCGIDTGHTEVAMDAAVHMVEDLERIGC